MIWNPEKVYTARIGGLLFRNVEQPIVYDGRSLISFSRESETGRLGVSFDLVQQDRSPIATVINSAVTLHSTEYTLLRGFQRVAVVENNTGRVWCEIRQPNRQLEYELDVSCIFIMESGFLIFLHPDRSKFGIANDGQPPNIAGLTISNSNPETGTGMVIHGSGYLIEVGFEHHHIGVSLNAPEEGNNAST